MSRISRNLSFFGSEPFGHIVGKAHGGAKKFILSRSLKVGDRTFDQMTQAVKLMVVTKVREDFIHAVNDVIGVQIPFFSLGPAHKIDGSIRRLFQFRIRMGGK